MPSRFLPAGVEIRLPELQVAPWHGRDVWFGSAITTFGSLTIGVPVPCAVIVAVKTQRPRAITPELAKALLDALHDRKHNPPHYRSAAATAPLADDDPGRVSALALEITTADSDSVLFTLAQTVQPMGEQIGTVVVEAEAPNDVAASAREEGARVALRRTFARAVSRGWPATSEHLAEATCVVIRHGPQRDEDNTWATWVGVLTRGGGWSDPVVQSAMPSTWRPVAVASAADPLLAGRVMFDFYR